MKRSVFKDLLVSEDEFCYLAAYIFPVFIASQLPYYKSLFSLKAQYSSIIARNV